MHARGMRERTCVVKARTILKKGRSQQGGKLTECLQYGLHISIWTHKINVEPGEIIMQVLAL